MVLSFKYLSENQQVNKNQCHPQRTESQQSVKHSGQIE